MFKKIAKHRANDASLTMHRPPLGDGGPLEEEKTDFTSQEALWHEGKYIFVQNWCVLWP